MDLDCNFAKKNGQPFQYCKAYTESVDIPYKNFSTWQAFETFGQEYSKIPMDGLDQPVYRFLIFDVENKSGVFLCASHLISDAWSIGIIAGKIGEYYDLLEQNKEITDKEHSYMSFCKGEQEYLNSEKYSKDEAFWLDAYQEQPSVAFIKPAKGLAKKPEADRYSYLLSKEQTQTIDAFCKEQKVSQAVLFECAIILYLSKINSDNANITIGIPVLNRTGREEKNAIGMCISTTPLSVTLNPKLTVKELFEIVTAKHFQIFRHQKFPYAHLLKKLHNKHHFSGNLYDVMVSFQNAKMDSPIEAKTKWFGNGYCEVGLAWHVDNRDKKDHYTINVDYQTDLFQDEQEIGYLTQRIFYILEQMMNAPQSCIEAVEIVAEAEKMKMIAGFNDTFWQYKSEQCVHSLFAEQVAKNPDQVALVFQNQSFTYQQLDEKANVLAGILKEKGICRGDIVPIISKRSWHVIAAMLGILKAGAAYMPVDPTFPKDRIEYMLELSEAKICLTYGYHQRLQAETLDLEEVNYDAAATSIPFVSQPNDPCYVIFTSGSTGKPKGVCLTHRNVCNYANANPNNIVVNCVAQNRKSIVSTTNIIFDIFVTESLMPLLNGVTIYLADDQQAVSQKLLNQLILDNQIEVLQTTPTKMRAYLADKNEIEYLSQLKTIILGGEALTADLYTEIRKNSSAQIYNIYGPAETTVWSTNKEVTNPDITIGKPIANTQIYILDEHQKVVPIGIAGELCIAGDGVGIGYVNRPDLTQERFIDNPFCVGTKMYRTGDLACWRKSGQIEYLGRIDTQVKIRGLRIELGEIESVMNEYPNIQIAAATDQKDDTGRQYLVGYYVAKGKVDEKELRQYLLAKLPKYMVPNYFAELETMPMTASGKIDRKNLPALQIKAPSNEYAAPQGEAEMKIARLWGQLLGIEKVGRLDDFMALGGDSLLIIQMIAQLHHDFQVELTVEDVLNHSQLRELAQFVETQKGQVSCIPARGLKTYPLLPQQMAIYSQWCKDQKSLKYNMPSRINLPKSIDRDRLKECLYGVFQNHIELKTRIVKIDGIVCAVFQEEAKLVIEDVHNEQDFFRPFDLEKDLLIRIGFTKTQLLFDMHHIISDGESIHIILTEIALLYQNIHTQSPAINYADYADYFNQLNFDEAKCYFKESLKCDFEKMCLPEKKTREAAKGESAFYHLTEKDFALGKQAAHRFKMTDTMLFFGLFCVLLSKYSGKADVLTSIVLQNRNHSETKNVIGMFVNTLPIYLKVEGLLETYLSSVKERLLKLFRYQEIPFWSIAEYVGIEQPDCINTSFVYQAYGKQTLKLGNEPLSLQWVDTNTAKFDITFEMTPHEHDCEIRIEYDASKYDRQIIDALFEGYCQILRHLDAKYVEEISVLSDTEYQKIVYDFNDTACDYDKTKCIHELFTERAKQHPDKIALVFENRQFSYQEIDEKSNALAHLLREQGVQRGEVVAIIAKRSWHIIVAMLGIMKAGAVYMPVDSAYPKERIEYMVRETGCKMSLLYEYDENLQTNTINLSQVNYEVNTQPVKNINQSSDPCYVIFTSGSTGKPKGVMISHLNVANFCQAKSSDFHYSLFKKCDYVLAVNSVVFDITIQEIWLPLLLSKTIIFASEKEIVDVRLLVQLCDNYQKISLIITPSKFKMYCSYQGFLSILTNFSLIMLGAERFPSDVVKEINSDCLWFNGYGPTECTCGASYKNVLADANITIGKPIANTQIYILDEHQKVVPIAVAGELCIAGDGVGMGYVNRPDLTQERFIDNPFCAGTKMYRTGDLACWRSNGEIEYLGRIDTQVKIRGLRIELGEIESVMNEYPNIQIAAATDQKDDTGRQYLVGYYVAKGKVDEKELRQHLLAKLPKYMVPNYFVKLETMPMTASGKIDRKNLPVPQISTVSADYIAPVTDQEILLCKVLEELFEMEKISVTDDFFEIGGDSLRAIEYVAKAHHQGIELSLQDVFDYPTVRQMCEHLAQHCRKKVCYGIQEFQRYENLLARNQPRKDFCKQKKALGNVFITGATGFLGAHIVYECLKNDAEKIYCLVRGGQERLQSTLHYYFGDLFNELMGSKIIALEGDITRKELSEQLPYDIQTVIHSAATVKHYGSSKYFEQVNVEGTQNVVNYAEKVKAQLIHISTLSVSGNSLVDAFEMYRSEQIVEFYETNFYMQQPLDNVYIHSKFWAERVVLEAMLRGLNAKIIRVGNLTNRVSDLKFQMNYQSNAFLTRVKAALELGVLPDYLLDIYAEFSPVDQTAEGVVKIAQYGGDYTVFHLNSNRVLYFDRMVEILNLLGVKMQVVSAEQFHEMLQASLQQAKTEYIYEAFQNDLDDQGRLVYDSNIHIMNDFTVWFMKQVGFEWAEIDLEYMEKYLNYFRELGYFEV